MPGLLNSEIETIRQHVAAKHEPWASAFAALIKQAEQALGEAPVHIRMNGGSPYFRQDAVYVPGKDGVRNPDSNTKSSALAKDASARATDLALAYRLTGEAEFAEKALEQIHAWCINQNTRMFATGRVEDAWTPGAAYGGDIVLMAAFPGLFFAGTLLREYPGWVLPARAAVKRWVRQMVDAQRPLMFFNGYEMYNNWEDARLLYLARGAEMLDDADLLIEVFDRWLHILPLKMTDAGELPRETERTRSMHYTLFALRSMTAVAEIARQHGVDLYHAEVNGRSLKKAIDFAAGYLLDMDKWSFEMIEPMHRPAAGAGADAEMGTFELAHRTWGDARYLEIIEAHGGRPVGGHATLLGAR
jgi:hypothetical protein